MGNCLHHYRLLFISFAFLGAACGMSAAGSSLKCTAGQDNLDVDGVSSVEKKWEPIESPLFPFPCLHSAALILFV